ncbi:hypothetical protein Tco_1263909 [Tanacetum coccineum]
MEKNRWSESFVELAQMVPLGFVLGVYKIWELAVLPLVLHFEYFAQSALNIRVILLTVKMEILLEPTSNKLMVEHAEFDESNAHVLERFYTLAGNHVKEILLKLNLPDHRILKDGGEGT